MNQIATVEPSVLAVFDEEHLARIENLCQANNLTRDEFDLFLFTARQRRLDPLKNQVCAVKRWSGRDRREVMTVQTTIDGFRVIASRTGKLAGMSDVTYVYNDDGSVFSASITVYRLTAGERCPYTATAFFDEYCATTKQGDPTRFWSKMGRHMIGKCAEALCLRKAFPEELSGLYTSDEMDQADNDKPSAPSRPAVVEAPSGPIERQRHKPETAVRAEQAPAPEPKPAPKPVKEERPVTLEDQILMLTGELKLLNEEDGKTAELGYQRALDAGKQEAMITWINERITYHKSSFKPAGR